MTVDPMLTTASMAAVFSPAARLQRMLDVEAALAGALAGAGAVPTAAAEAIAAACRLELFDVDELHTQAAVAGTLAIPLVARLRELVDVDARGFVHWGATSQDVIDSGAVLQMREALELLVGDLTAIASRCAELAEAHRTTVMAGRTLLQHALPVPFGLKAAQWLVMAANHVERLRSQAEALPVQLGGAAGTLAAYGNSGIDVVERLAAALGLAVADVPWHTNRAVPLSVVSAVALAVRGVGKVATDIVLLAQTEVGEVSEATAPDKGRSSALPHKRNAVDAVAARAAVPLTIGAVTALLAAGDAEHERAAGSWQAEQGAIADTFRYAAAVLARTRAALDGLHVDADRMRRNLDATHGLSLSESFATALAPHIGRAEANRVVAAVTAAAVDSGIDLLSAARRDERVTRLLDDAALDGAFDPGSYLGSSDAFIDRALHRFRAVLGAA